MPRTPRETPAGRAADRTPTLRPTGRWLAAAALVGIAALLACFAPGGRAAAAPSVGATPASTPGPSPGAPAGEPVALVADGATPWRVANVSPGVRPAAFAARELARYVERMSGATLALDGPADSEHASNPGGDAPRGPVIVLGLRKDLARADAAVLPQPAHGHDGYAIRVSPASDDGKTLPRIVVAGESPRGVVYAVYDLLERLGCRFFHPALDADDPEVVPRARTLALAPGAWAVASPMKYRTLAWFHWRNEQDPADVAVTPEQLRAEIDWAMKARYSALESLAAELPPDTALYRALDAAKERGLMVQAPGHNFGLFLVNDPHLFEKHPEWFGMRGGRRSRHAPLGAQFCWSNADARKHFVDNVEAFVRARPEIDVLMLSGLDGGDLVPACGCPECTKRNPSDNVLLLMNEVVERLARFAPHVVVETLGGYQYSTELPREVQPDPRLRVEWAHWGRPITRDYSWRLYKHRKALQAWAELFDGRLTAFQYYSDQFSYPWMAAPYVSQMAGDRRFLLELGADGMLNLLYPEGSWWRETMNGYLAGRTFHDAALDPTDALRDYALHYHGPDAGPLMAEYYLAWARSPELAMKSNGVATSADRAVLREQRERLLDPALARSAGDAVLRHRMTKVDTLHRLAEGMMDAELAKADAAALVAAGDRAGAERRLEEGLAATKRLEAFARERTSTRTGVIDAGFVGGPLRHKQTTIEKELERVRAGGDAAPPAPGAS